MSEHLQQTLSYLSSEINRIQTIAGTLSTVETEHHKELTNLSDDSKLLQIASEEQSASRQLGEIKNICLALSQKIEDLQSNLP
ncbi:hypothetical protein [Pueribacillus sp. YX66]|uniref:hypothetical protein n=1 Tax=Pueribacillus sp. YX66 TaxID=3229242 RepID=UPI00358D5DE1